MSTHNICFYWQVSVGQSIHVECQHLFSIKNINIYIYLKVNVICLQLCLVL